MKWFALGVIAGSAGTVSVAAVWVALMESGQSECWGLVGHGVDAA